MEELQNLIDNLILEALDNRKKQKIQQNLKNLEPQKKAEFLFHLVQDLGLGEDYMDITDLVTDKIQQSQQSEDSGKMDVKPAS